MGAAASVPTDTCNALTRRGTACSNAAGKGTEHVGYGRCRNHGGASPSGRAHAARLKVADLVKPEGITGPAAIERGLALQNGLVSAIEAQVSEAGLIVDGALNPLVRTLTDELRTLVQIGKLASEAHLEERHMRLEERYGAQLEQLLAEVFETLQLKPADEARALAVVERRLAIVAPAEAA